VAIEFPEAAPSTLTPEDRPLEILYEDEHLLVLNKPAQLTVHPSPTQMQGTLVNVLVHHEKELSTVGGSQRPGIVHRLDKDTSGALVISKTDEAHRKLVDTFSKHAIRTTVLGAMLRFTRASIGRDQRQDRAQRG